MILEGDPTTKKKYIITIKIKNKNPGAWPLSPT